MMAKYKNKISIIYWFPDERQEALSLSTNYLALELPEVSWLVTVRDRKFWSNATRHWYIISIHHSDAILCTQQQYLLFDEVRELYATNTWGNISGLQYHCCLFLVHIANRLAWLKNWYICIIMYNIIWLATAQLIWVIS